MFGYTEAPRAWWMTRGMARLAGVDLPRVMVEGWLTRRELAEIVDRCATCPHAVTCGRWLASGTERRIAGFCPNRDALEALVAH